MKCFHHVDADGYCAAYVVHKRFPNMKPEDFIPINYGMNIDWFNCFEKDEPIIIVDFSFEVEDMKRILKKTSNVTWIDHHKSAIEKYKDFEADIKGIRYDGIAGCMLTWLFFYIMSKTENVDLNKESIKAPWAIKYIADYDVWKYEYGDETRHFKLGLDAEGLKHPCDPVWDKMIADIEYIKELISNGVVCEKYRNSLAKLACESGFEYELEGYKFFCLNINDPIINSEWFGDYIHKYDGVCAYGYDGKNNNWMYSLYTERIDVSEIAKKFGGGGHMKASGFTSNKNIFQR